MPDASIQALPCHCDLPEEPSVGHLSQMHQAAARCCGLAPRNPPIPVRRVPYPLAGHLMSSPLHLVRSGNLWSCYQITLPAPVLKSPGRGDLGNNHTNDEVLTEDPSNLLVSSLPMATVMRRCRRWGSNRIQLRVS